MGRGANPFSVIIANILEFLASLQSSGKSYSSINIHRSMLSTTLKPAEGIPIGEHPEVVRLLKGCYNRNPPRPKYSATWDSNQVIAFVSTLGENDSLSLYLLATKMVTLIALATLMRVSEIAAIGLKSVVFSQNGVRFALETPRKAQRNGPMQSFSITSCPESTICPVAAIAEYIKRTSKFRADQNSDKLVIAAIAPHKPVSSNTVSRWIKCFLKSAGINTEMFGAHSTRSAAASKAAKSGISLGAILRAGSWAQESTFGRFYNRSAEPTVESAVFGQTHN